ncbi:MAG: hypothetical protein AAF571_06315 [Verrucomicrobiota bacterium]
MMEMMMALAVFVIAIAPVARILNDTLEAYLLVEENQALHSALKNHTNFLLSSNLREGQFESAPDDYPDITIKTTIEPYEPDVDSTTDEEYVQVTNVLLIKLVAEGKEDSLESTFYLRKLN